MRLMTCKLGDLIECTTEVNDRYLYNIDDVKGMTITKEIISTKADVINTDLSKFLVVHPNEFVFNPRTHGKKIGFGYNDTDKIFLISWNNIAFRVKELKKYIVLPKYLFLHFNREEWDREACYRSWGSSTEVFSWNSLCEMELNLPSIEVQQRYIDIYDAMLVNQKNYERGLKDLKLSLDAIIDNFKHSEKRILLRNAIEEIDVRNEENSISVVHGVNKEKQFMPSVASGADLSKYKIVNKGQFACNLMHVGRDVAVPVALHKGDKPIIVSPAYFVFQLKTDKILPEYAMMWLSRNETDRYAWFLSDTNVRSGMEKKRFCEIEIPVPDIQKQKALVNIYNVYMTRHNINEKLKTKIKEICPILIKGSLEQRDACK